MVVVGGAQLVFCFLFQFELIRKFYCSPFSFWQRRWQRTSSLLRAVPTGSATSSSAAGARVYFFLLFEFVLCFSIQTVKTRGRSDPAKMAKLWPDMKWFLLAAFAGNLSGAIGWSFRTLAANMIYSSNNPVDDPALKVPSRPVVHPHISFFFNCR
jgi:hypothetical protein